MKSDAERFIEALVGAELMAERTAQEHRLKGSKKMPVVTVSRHFGALGKIVAQALADRLQVRCFDRTILEEVAHRANVDIDLVKSLDERVKQAGSDWWFAFTNGKLLTQETYQKHLAKVILSISQTGGVIVGRGANEVLDGRTPIRVRIVGSLNRCAKRIAAREHIDFEAARQRVKRTNRERALYIRKLYGIDIEESSRYDLIINSDRFSVDAMAELIVSSVEKLRSPPRKPFQND